jgi:hypothetical protein
MNLQDLAHRLVRPSHAVMANCMIRIRVDILDRLWSNAPDYIPVGQGKDPVRGNAAYDFINAQLREKHPRVYAPTVLHKEGRTWFEDGTHRFLVFRSGGVETIDVATPRSTKNRLVSMGLVEKSIFQMFDIWDKATPPPEKDIIARAVA